MFRLLALCALVLTVSACDSSDTDAELAPNSFVLSVQADGVSGAAVTRSQAYSGTFVNDEESQSFGILLGADPQSSDVESAEQPFLGFVRQGDRPAVGRYAFPMSLSLEQEPDAGTFVGLYVDPSQFVIPEDEDVFEINGFYFTTGGELTITESSATRLAGTFSGTARPFDFMTGGFRGETIRFEGRFHAVPSEGFEGGGLISGPLSVTAQ